MSASRAGGTVSTPYGAVRGTEQDGVRRYLAIPYAAAPVGRRRFAPPEKPDAWTGIREACERGANSPQIIRAFPGIDVTPLVGRGWQPGDEFLTANIWTPADASSGRPVLVFIHGGAFIAGSNDAPVHDGSAFARAGVVCVAINYRLGVEGFLPIPGAATNLGLRDQIAALEWTRETIAAFGGDPHNVTVAGESAGAMSIANLLASPLARGLFRRAIIQSGHGSMVRAADVASRVTHLVARHLGIAPTVAEFRGRSLQECSAAVEAISRPEVSLDLRDTRGLDPAYGLTRFLPIYGDDVLPQPPLDALTQGAASDVDLLIGTNREEMSLYFTPTGVRDQATAALAERLLGASHPRAREVLEAYGIEGSGRKAGAVLTEAMSDLVFRLPARRFADCHRGRTHLYEFGWRSPACGGELGACHGLELPFVFDTLSTCSGPAGIAGAHPPQALAHEVHGIWVRFVTQGHLAWAPYERSTRLCMALERAAAARDTDTPAARFEPPA